MAVYILPVLANSHVVLVSLSSCMPLGAQNVYDNKAYSQGRRSLMQRSHLFVNTN